MIWWIVAILCGYFIKGVCGFANTLVLSTILSFHTNNINITPVDVVMGFPANCYMAWKERKSIEWKVCLPVATFLVIGIIPGVLFLKNVDTVLVKRVFGGVIIFLGIEMLLRDYLAKDKKQSKIYLALIGLLSGLLCGMFGIGALVSAYVGKVTKDIHSFKANICLVFVLENIFRIVLYTCSGIITLAALKQAALLIPVMAAGMLLGMASSKYLSEKLVRMFVIVMLILSGAALVLRA